MRGTDKMMRLGRKQKSKQKWRRPRGKHGKMREGKHGQRRIKIGLKQENQKQGILIVRNLKDLENAKDEIIIARIGKKKRIEIEKKAKERNIKVLNEKDLKNPSMQK